MHVREMPEELRDTCESALWTLLWIAAFRLVRYRGKVQLIVICKQSR